MTRLTDAEAAQLEAELTATKPIQPDPDEPGYVPEATAQDAMLAGGRWPPAPADDGYCMGFAADDRRADAEPTRNSGVSIPEITDRRDRRRITTAIAFADRHPEVRWYVVKVLGAWGLGYLLPAWPELASIPFDRDGQRWRFHPQDASQATSDRTAITESYAPAPRKGAALVAGAPRPRVMERVAPHNVSACDRERCFACDHRRYVLELT